MLVSPPSGRILKASFCRVLIIYDTIYGLRCVPGGIKDFESFIREGSATRFNPLPFNIPFLVEKVALLYTFY